MGGQKLVSAPSANQILCIFWNFGVKTIFDPLDPWRTGMFLRWIFFQFSSKIKYWGTISIQKLIKISCTVTVIITQCHGSLQLTTDPSWDDDFSVLQRSILRKRTPQFLTKVGMYCNCHHYTMSQKSPGPWILTRRISKYTNVCFVLSHNLRFHC